MASLQHRYIQNISQWSIVSVLFLHRDLYSTAFICLVHQWLLERLRVGIFKGRYIKFRLIDWSPSQLRILNSWLGLSATENDWEQWLHFEDLIDRYLDWYLLNVIFALVFRFYEITSPGHIIRREEIASDQKLISSLLDIRLHRV